MTTITQSIQNRIYDLRGERIMLDFDLASLYEVETRVLNQAVKRNIMRFPQDFMFRLTTAEWRNLRSQIVTSSTNNTNGKSEALVITKRNTNVIPYAFTEQGVAMLSAVLNSEKAISMHVAIMRAFVEIRRIIFKQNDLTKQIQEIRDRLMEHDTQLSSIYDALENLLDENAADRKWSERPRIGFK